MSIPNERMGADVCAHVLLHSNWGSIVYGASSEATKHPTMRHNAQRSQQQPQTMISLPRFLVGQGLPQRTGLCMCDSGAR